MINLLINYFATCKLIRCLQDIECNFHLFQGMGYGAKLITGHLWKGYKHRDNDVEQVYTCVEAYVIKAVLNRGCIHLFGY